MPQVGSEAGDVQLGAGDFAAAPRISFDKAVLERHEAVAVTALDAMWRDVGTWAEVAELYPADGDGNRKREGFTCLRRAIHSCSAPIA